MTRREFIKASILGAGLIYSGVWVGACSQATVRKNPLYVPSDQGGLLSYYIPSNRFTLTAKKAVFEIISGKQTNMFVYTVEENGKTYYNPIIVIRSGQDFAVNFLNLLGEESIVHWHGFRAPWKSDGHPSYAVGSGKTYSYPQFTIIDRSGTYFYHPHPHGRTGYQVYNGLASMIIVEDEDEDNIKSILDLSYGLTDIPLIIQDKTFNADGSLIYNPLGMNGNMGFWGDTVLVNLTTKPFLEVERRIYRFRILNGSNARPYRLVLKRGSENMRFWVIGVEGGLLDKPIEVREILVAPGERIDILVDFRDANLNDILRFYSLNHNLVDMGEGMRGMADLINREFEILEFRVLSDTTYDRDIPKSLSTINQIDTSLAKTQNVILGMSNGKFNIDGLTWNSSDPLADYGYNYNNRDVVIFRITNNTSMYHPMHFHGFQFQILSRQNSPKVIRDLAIDQYGRMATDLGWKDTAIVGPNETVEVAMDMSHSFGEEQTYLFHCHILEHHDAGMMINYRVKA